MIGVCLGPEDYVEGWDLVELQFEKSVSLDREFPFSQSFTVHAPHYLSLTSPKLQKVDDAKMRILEADDAAKRLDARLVVFRGGFYSKRPPAEAYESLKKACGELQKQMYTRIGIETAPRQSQFGTVEEVLRLAEETGVVPVLNIGAIQERGGAGLGFLQEVGEPYCHFDGTVDLEELAAALPQKYTLMAEDLKSAERMRELI